MNLEQRLQRQKLIQAAIVLAAGRNQNIAAHTRRLLRQKFNVDVFESEVEAEASQLATDALRALSRLLERAS